jgi:hypothetical protein
MQLSTIQEDVSVVNVWHQVIKDKKITHVWSIFIVSFWLKKHNISDALSASAIRQSLQLISLQPLQHILDHLRGTALSISHFHMMMEAHTGCETTFFNQNERVKDAPCLCQFNTTALTHILRSI